MSEQTDELDRLLAHWRRVRIPAALSFAILIPVAWVTILWWHSNPTDACGVVASGVGYLAFVAGALTVASWSLSTRARLLRVQRVTRRFGGVYHDSSPTRLCPRCGLPMDRAMGGAFYTGRPSPLELCHRCLRSDEPYGHNSPS